MVSSCRVTAQFSLDQFDLSAVIRHQWNIWICRSCVCLYDFLLQWPPTASSALRGKKTPEWKFLCLKSSWLTILTLGFFQGPTFVFTNVCFFFIPKDINMFTVFFLFCVFFVQKLEVFARIYCISLCLHKFVYLFIKFNYIIMIRSVLSNEIHNRMEWSKVES